MPSKSIPLAIAYDFDGTLAPGNMQEHSFIPNLGMTTKNFWEKVKTHSTRHDMDEILAYMDLMIHEADLKGEKINEQAFKDHGKKLPLFEGVENWFKRINQYGKTKKINISHFIISSGLREMIKGTLISKEFDYIFASGFRYEQHGVARWPALAMNYTTKTQCLFRINKGINNSYDNRLINSFLPESSRPIPFTNMIYIGDGETDIPCMKIIKDKGGHSIAVYDPKKRKTINKDSPKEKCMTLLKQQRASYISPADYSENKKLDKLIKAIIDNIATESNLSKMKKTLNS